MTSDEPFYYVGDLKIVNEMVEAHDLTIWADLYLDQDYGEPGTYLGRFYTEGYQVEGSAYLLNEWRADTGHTLKDQRKARALTLAIRKATREWKVRVHYPEELPLPTVRLVGVPWTTRFKAWLKEKFA